MDIGRDYNLPFIAFTPTWRANAERIKKSYIPENLHLNRDCAYFLRDIIKTYGVYADKMMLGGLMGCRGDSYKPEEALSIKESEGFHQWQADELNKSDVDFIMVPTLPAYSEAAGIALVLSQMPKPYVLSFVIGPDGKLLDGTELVLAIKGIDALVRQQPLFFMVNCVYPDHFQSALKLAEKRDSDTVPRILGFQANTSSRSHDELDGMKETETENPYVFAEKMGHLYRRFRIKILGGCCGTDDTHIKCLAEEMLRPL